jgi:GAF domain-containing protein
MSFPVGPNEEERLQALAGTGILGSAPDPVFEALCAQARQAFGVPIALVSLVDRDRQWFKAEQGLGVCETARDVAFCNYTILADEVFVVEDAQADARFAANPLVTGPPFIRFYAGAPLVYSRSIRLGSFCLIDTEPRLFSRGDRAELAVIADRATMAIVSRAIEREAAAAGESAGR